ncbi:hypothetical protein [Streptomyces sp. YIM 98790]|uniref:hypothetical protein n=1 Tax=Streptomyces sp. YIM 98790 TaxID=2689077 RepID=UPI00140C450D|nr:hypothetical protein [Streptomyces sp. YIM 98790]
MVQNPHTPQRPQDADAAGSTQMFRAFVDDQPARDRASGRSGMRAGVVLGVILGVLVLAAVGWLALG